MDYCSSCRRHLNGALVCPGCGAYAPDIAPGAATSRIVPAQATAAAAYEFSPSDTWHDDGGPGDEAAASTDPVPAPRGRAARRREMARWKKNKRRAVVATAVALVGGGLTVTAMDRQSADQAQAADAPAVPAPDAAGMDSAEERTQRHPGGPAPRSGTHRSSHTAAGQSPATDVPRRQSAAAPVHATPLNARPDAPAARRAVAASAPQPGTSIPPTVTETVADPTSTPPQQAAAPADKAGNTASTANTGNTGSDSAAPASPPPASTSPSQICVLVLCIG
ncbi:SCO2400 family protein [Streptomyces sp. NPDC002399]